MEFNNKVSPNAEALYRNGLDFQKAAERCLNMEETGTLHIIDEQGMQILPAPAVVNAAFACEMFLKALILRSGQQYPTNRNGHNLKFLFDMLPETIKSKVCHCCIPNDPEAENKFISFLSRHSKDFVDIRYYVTRAGWQGMTPIMLYSYAHNIGNATRLLLSNWEESING